MNSFEEIFKENRDNPPPLGMVMKYNILRVNKDTKHLIFVEGSSDERFYSNTNISVLRDDSAYIYQSYEEQNGGKESVFYAYKEIKRDEKLKEDSDRCIYIVDKDWDSSLKSINRWVNKKDESYISVTQGHSMECYFLEDYNVNVIFDKLGVQGFIEDFLSKEKVFIESTAEYWAMKSVIQYAKKQEIICRYRKRYGFEEIFLFDFRKEPFYNQRYMNEEVVLMKKAIEGNEQLERYFSIWKEKIKQEPRNIRGHDYFNFLKAYLEYVLSKRISDKVLFELVNEFKVEMNVKYVH